MARKRATSIDQSVAQYRCKDCAHSYDWHEMGADGKPFLCRCPYKKEGGKFSIFLDDRVCARFKIRTDDR